MNSCSISSSSSCIVYNLYSPRTEFVGLKKLTLNLKFCGLQVHDLSLSYWEIWNDGLELLQICSEQNFTSGTFIFENYKIKSSSVMRNTYQSHMHEAYKDIILPTCCLYLFELCQILWPLWVVFHTLMIENHVHTTSTCKNFHTGRIAFPYHPLIHILSHVPYSIKSLPKFSPIRAWAMYWKKRGHMKAHEKKWTHEGPCKNKVISHAQIRRERQNQGAP